MNHDVILRPVSFVLTSDPKFADIERSCEHYSVKVHKMYTMITAIVWQGSRKLIQQSMDKESISYQFSQQDQSIARLSK